MALVRCVPGDRAALPATTTCRARSCRCADSSQPLLAYGGDGLAPVCSVKEKRILVVVANPLGGIRSYLLYNARRLLESGYVFTFLSPEGEAFDSFKNDVASWPGVELLGVPVRGRRFSFWPSVRRAIRSGRFSLIHSQGLRAGVEVAFANYLRGIPHVITLHDTRHDNDFKGRFRWIKRYLAGRLSARAHVIIAVSNDCAQNHLAFFPEWRRSHCKIDVIYNGVDVERLTAAAKLRSHKTLRAEFGWADEIRILGYFGRFMPEKGFSVLLDALRELAHQGCADRVRLVAAKDPYGYGREYMHEVAQDDVLSPMVRFIDPVSEIASILPQVDVVVVPSLREAYGLVAAEAMVLGVPVVGSNAIGLREVLSGTPSLSPPAGDARALALALEQAVCSRSKQQAEAYATEACSRFDNRVAAQKLLGLYEALSR
ncbi:glycosyltransferase family 1 protein [archaeon]|nr:MAG: glycosyltransferase family 1 protein [archaeon]